MPKAHRQREFYELLNLAGHDGLTNRELAEMCGKTASSTSGTTSLMNQRGLIVRLSNDHNRDGNAVYVLPKYQNGRDLYRSPADRAKAAGVQLGTDPTPSHRETKAEPKQDEAVAVLPPEMGFPAEEYKRAWKDGFEAGWRARSEAR